MMDSLRTAANSLVLKIIFGIIIVSFILTGVSGYLIGGGNNYAAKVNDQEISRGQFENAFNSERNRMQQQLGDQYSELAANEGYMKTLRQQVLNRLIDEALLDQYARELKLGISDEQVKQAIFATPAFQVDGKFDNSRYNGILNQMGMTADQYAQALRNQLTTQQLINGVAGTDFMLKGETDELAALVAQQRVVREATIDVNALAAKQPVTEQEIASYYEQNKNNFMTPEQFRVSYIKLDAATMQQPVSDADIQSYYDQHQDQFTQPQRTRYSIIQTKTEDEAKAVLDELNKGGDFAALAKEKSADIISARNGGDMGWLEDATIPDELKNAGLKEKGQLSGVIKSSVGFLIVRLDDIQPAKVKSLDEVRDDIAAKVKHEKALDAYYALQQKVSDAASNDTESLAGAEQAAGVKATQTGWFSKDNLPEELNFKPVADAIFNGGLVGENGAPGGFFASMKDEAKNVAAVTADYAVKDALGVEERREPRFVKVGKDGTLPHFIPDRRERLLAALDSLGQPQDVLMDTRLWGHVIIDPEKCSSCQMCATFCPTGAIAKYADEDGSIGVTHRPVDCVKCRCCTDICPEGALELSDEVFAVDLLSGAKSAIR